MGLYSVLNLHAKVLAAKQRFARLLRPRLGHTRALLCKRISSPLAGKLAREAKFAWTWKVKQRRQCLIERVMAPDSSRQIREALAGGV